MKNLLKIKFETYEKIITALSSVTVVLIIFLSYLIAKVGTVDLVKYESIMSFVAILNIFIILIGIRNNYYKFRIVDLFVFLLIIFAIISTLFSVNIKTSLIGVSGRNEGLIMIITYYTLFILNSLIKNDKYKKIIIITFLASSLLQLHEKMFSTHVIGLVGHYNFFGTFCLLVYSLSIGLFIFTKSKKGKYFYLAISSVFFPYLIGCVTGSVNIGLVFVFIAIISYLIIVLILKLLKKTNNKLKSFSILLVKTVLVISVIILCFMKINSHTKDVVKEFNTSKEEVKEMASGNVTNNWGSQRGFIWKETLKIVPKYWFHGVGIDCLIYAFDGSYLITPWTNRIVDKVHNEYLQLLVTEGIFSLITYLVFLFYIFFTSIRNIFKYEKLDNSIYIGLFLAFIGYAIQAFANIRVTRVAPFFFILTGLLYQRYRIKNEKK